MNLLDNAIYVTNACSLLDSSTGYRVIPLGISCLLNGDLFLTSLVNLTSINLILYFLFKSFHFSKKQILTGIFIFGLNSYIAFPYFYAAAHSYVYTIMACILSLYTLDKFTKHTVGNTIALVLCAVFLLLVRSEGPLYFGFSCFAFFIFKYLKTSSLKEFFKIHKILFQKLFILIVCIILFNFSAKVLTDSTSNITNNLVHSGYTYQFPRESFYAVSMWATLDYLRAFITPYYMNFYGNYLDWFQIHFSKSFQYVLYFFFGLITLLATYFIFSRRKSSFSYFIIALSIFIIPGFLISSFLRNQWFYPSRSLIGCFLSLPFFLAGIYHIKNLKLQKVFISILILFSCSTFIIHNIFHFKTEETMYQYENKFLGLEHPTLNKTYAQYLFKKSDFLRATQILREAGRIFPEKGIFLSANHFYLWSENLYWSAAGSHFYKSPLTEEAVLKKLYNQPNFFGAMACLQDKRIHIDKCKHPKLLTQLCNPIYKRKFGYTYYKKPRMKAEHICAHK